MCKKIDELMEENAKLKEALARVEAEYDALATQPADSVAVNRLRLALVAWDAELAEQDYRLTADDLREKLREIHRDIDRLMPEQTQPAVRGAEHE